MPSCLVGGCFQSTPSSMWRRYMYCVGLLWRQKAGEDGEIFNLGDYQILNSLLGQLSSDGVTARYSTCACINPKRKTDFFPTSLCQLWQLNKLQLWHCLGPAYSYNCISATMQIQAGGKTSWANADFNQPSLRQGWEKWGRWDVKISPYIVGKALCKVYSVPANAILFFRI